jgi:glycosyltransferase involved in cell wall biosynthesis
VSAVALPPKTGGGEGLRVLHIVSSDAFAGIERHALHLTRELRALGCDAELACPPTADRLRAEATASGIPVLPSASARPGSWLAAVARDVVADPPGALHVHDGRSAIAGVLLSLVVRRPLIRTQHFERPASVERNGWSRRAALAMHRGLNRRLDGYIAVSQSVADRGLERAETGNAKVAVIPPAIELPSDEAVSRAQSSRARMARPVVAFAGRLEAERRVDVLLQAAARVHEQLPDCHFVIAGSGNAAGDLKSLAHTLGLDDVVTWRGWVSDPTLVLEEAHAYVNPIPREGFGMAMAEAMAFALPVIAVQSNASSEMIEAGINGLLVPPNDAHALAAAIVGLVSDRGNSAEMGEAAHQKAVSSYGAERTAQATLAFYRQLRERAIS